MKFKISPSGKEDIYRDIVRVPEQYRRDKKGAIIPEGSVCKLTVAGRTVYVIVRGNIETIEPTIRMDERLRNLLMVDNHDVVEVQIARTRLWGQFLWAWNASDPAYRVAAKMALLSVALGLIGLVTGVISLVGRR